MQIIYSRRQQCGFVRMYKVFGQINIYKVWFMNECDEQGGCRLLGFRFSVQYQRFKKEKFAKETQVFEFFLHWPFISNIHKRMLHRVEF